MMGGRWISWDAMGETPMYLFLHKRFKETMEDCWHIFSTQVESVGLEDEKPDQVWKSVGKGGEKGRL